MLGLCITDFCWGLTWGLKDGTLLARCARIRNPLCMSLFTKTYLGSQQQHYWSLEVHCHRARQGRILPHEVWSQKLKMMRCCSRINGGFCMFYTRTALDLLVVDRGQRCNDPLCTIQVWSCSHNDGSSLKLKVYVCSCENLALAGEFHGMQASSGANGQSRVEGIPLSSLHQLTECLTYSAPLWYENSIVAYSESSTTSSELGIGDEGLWITPWCRMRHSRISLHDKVQPALALQIYTSCIFGHILSKLNLLFQEENSGGQTRNRVSWERLPRETDAMLWYWGTRRVAWFTWRCTTGTVRKVSRHTYHT